MNTLAYGLLSLIATKPQSGYELTQRISVFWRAKHSQIYPLLSMLEEKGLVQFEQISQTDKPDKKVYTVTGEGELALRKWFDEPTDEPVIRDELALKLYCIWLGDPAAAKRLIEERIAFIEVKLEKLKKSRSELEARSGETPETTALSSRYFGAHILLRKAISSCETDLEWCEWVISTYLS